MPSKVKLRSLWLILHFQLIGEKRGRRSETQHEMQMVMTPELPIALGYYPAKEPELF